MKKKRMISMVSASLLLLSVTNVAQANSSWHWVANNPLTILPWVAIGTIMIEAIAIRRINRIKGIGWILLVVVAANALSFLFPYVFVGLFPEMGMENLSFLESIHYAVNKLPFYIVGIGFLLLTLLVEIPVVYIVLRKERQNRKRLFLSIALINIITTTLMAAVERIVCVGRW